MTDLTSTTGTPPGQPATSRGVVLVVLAGCIISLVGFGIRSTMGLFLEPMTVTNGWSRETFALAIAIQNLLWGICVPIAAALTDRFGPTKTLSAGALIYASGLAGMAFASSGTMLHLTAGVLTGIGTAFTAFSIVLAIIAQVVSEERRSFALGLGTAATSLGQVLFSPITQNFISDFGAQSTLLILAASALTIIPLVLLMGNPGQKAESTAATQSLKAALVEALAHRGYVLLTLGFFVCGFHVAFIAVHLPAYLKDLGLAPQVGAYAIAIIGLFNIVGSFVSGIVGQRYSKKLALALIYAARALVIAWMLLMPKTEIVIFTFAALMGLLWLSTVPLTSGIVAQVFGVRYMATLVGVVFFSHQMGSFIGVWLGGYLYDTTGTYDAVWWTGVALSVVATVLHLPINEQPVSRPLATAPAT